MQTTISFYLSIITGIGLCLFALYLAKEDDYFEDCTSAAVVEYFPATLGGGAKEITTGSVNDDGAESADDDSRASVGEYGALLERGGVPGGEKQGDDEDDDDDDEVKAARVHAARV